jgi:hypothetical protein
VGKGLCGLFVGVFVGALAYELLKKTELGKKTARGLSKGVKSAKDAFVDGYRAVEKFAPSGA